MSETRQRILDSARALFNERGLHRVGVRDIARELGMSPGNLAYHFATKDDLVAALVTELHDLAKRAVFGALPETFTMADLYRTAVAAMRGILSYRFVLLSYVDAVTSSPELRRLESRLAIEPRRRHDAMVTLLVESGELDRRALAPRAEYLYEQAQMVSGGWLTAAALAPRPGGDEAVVLHYAKVGCVLLEAYLTDKGRRSLRRVLAGAYDEALRRAPPPLRAIPNAR